MSEEVKGDYNTPIVNEHDLGSVPNIDPEDERALENLVEQVEKEESGAVPVQETPTAPDNNNESTEDNVESTESVEAKPENIESVEQVTTDPAETTEKVSEQKPVEEDNLEKEFPTPKHLSPEKKSNWANLRQRASTFEKEAKEVKSKYEQAVEALANYEKGVALPDPIKKEIEELRSFRRMADIQSDPEFQKEFIHSIVSEEDKLFSKFQELGMSNESVKQIIQDGGILSKSRDDWARLILGSLKGEEYEFVREDIKQSITKIYQTEEKRKEAIKTAASNYDNYFKEKTEKSKQSSEVDHSQIVEEVTKIQKEIPWANEPKKPINPTPEQSKAFEKSMSEWNTHVDRFQKGLYSKDPKIRAQTAMAACGYFKLAEDIKSYQAENAILKQQIQKLQSVGRTNSSPIINAPRPIPKTKEVDYMMDDKDALEQMLKEMGQ